MGERAEEGVLASLESGGGLSLRGRAGGVGRGGGRKRWKKQKGEKQNRRETEGGVSE